MNIDIGDYDPIAKAVSVTFTVEGKEPFTRPVNAVRDEDGAYDAAATRARIDDEVAPGVQVKFDIGLIGNPPVALEPAPTEA